MKKYLLFPIFLLLLATCTKVLHVTQPQLDSVRIEDAAKIQPAEEINELIDPYRNQLEAEMNQVIGTCAQELVKEKPEGTLGNWTADLIHKKSEAYYQQPIDFAFVNYGGLRIPFLPKGAITKSTIFELMPFDNGLVVLHADANTVEQFFVRVAEYGGWPMSHHVKFKIKNEQPIDISISGKSIEKDKIYKIAMSDFIANGGDNCYFFKDKKRDLLGKLFRDAIIEHVQDLTVAGKEVEAQKEGRIILMD